MVAVADDQGFESKIDKFDSKVDFVPYVSGDKLGLGELTNIISYNVPEHMLETVKSGLKNPDISHHKAMNLLLKRPLKNFNDKKPIYSYKEIDRSNSILGEAYDILQKEYLEFLSFMIRI